MLVDRAVSVAAARVAQLLADAALEEALAALAAHHAVVTTCACAVNGNVWVTVNRGEHTPRPLLTKCTSDVQPYIIMLRFNIYVFERVIIKPNW